VCSTASPSFEDQDADGDGVVTRQEHEAAQQKQELLITAHQLLSHPNTDLAALPAPTGLSQDSQGVLTMMSSLLQQNSAMSENEFVALLQHVLGRDLSALEAVRGFLQDAVGPLVAQVHKSEEPAAAKAKLKLKAAKQASSDLSSKRSLIHSLSSCCCLRRRM